MHSPLQDLKTLYVTRLLRESGDLEYKINKITPSVLLFLYSLLSFTMSYLVFHYCDTVFYFIFLFLYSRPSTGR